MQNPVFLRTLLYDGTACEQKTGNAKTRRNSMFLRVFIDIIYQVLRTRNDVVIVPYNSSLIELRRGYALFRQPQDCRE